MDRRCYRFRAVGAAFFGALLFVQAPTPVLADSFDDIYKAIAQAHKAFQESRLEEAKRQLALAVDLIRSFKPSDKDYIREAIYWINAKESTQALKAIAQALDKNPKAAEAYFLRGYVYGKVLPNTVANNSA